MITNQNLLKNLRFVAILFILFVSLTTRGQGNYGKTPLDSAKVDAQFQFIIDKSGNYNGNNLRYEVVRRSWINKLRGNIKDSLRSQKQKIKELQGTIDRQHDEINGLKSNLENTTKNLDSITENKNNISLFGITISKKSYKMIMWTIVIILFVLLLLFIYKFRNSNILTQEAKSSLTELDKEFEEHRRRALEREQKVRRQLQDEINKQKNK